MQAPRVLLFVFAVIVASAQQPTKSTGGGRAGSAGGVTITGTPTTGNCVEWASSSSIQDSGDPCGTGSGSGSSVSQANYSQSFTSQTSVSLTHNLGTSNLLVKCYDTSNVEVAPDTTTIGGSAPYDVTVTFVTSFSGRCAVNGGSGIITASPSNYSQAFTAQTSVSLTHSLGTSNVLTKCYDGSDVEVQPNTVTIGGSAPYNVTVTFLAAQTGRCTVSGGSGVNGPLYCADAGSNDTYACTLPVCPTAYAAGQNFLFKANTANTGTATANFCSLGAKTIYKLSSGVTTTLADNDIRAGQIVLVAYDGTNFLMLSALGNAASSSIAYATAEASASDAHTADSTWEDVNSMSVSVTATSSGVVLCWGEAVFAFTSANWQYNRMRLDVDSTTQSQVLWNYRLDTNPTNNPYHTASFHHVFTGLTAASHTFKMQTEDGGSSQNRTFYERKLTCHVL